jgi:hypothetical protein
VRFVHETAYDADPTTVHAMLSDRAFREEVCEYQQVLRYAVTVEQVDGKLCVDVDQVQAARHIPSYAQRLVGDEIEIEQRETWHSPTDATLEVKIPGKPVRMVGTISLRVEGQRTVETVAGEIRVPIPLFGGRVEELVGDVFRLALDAENTVGQRRISGSA